MVEITFRVPSKAHQYGYVEIRHQGGDEMPSPEQLASDYTEYVARFQKAEMAAKPKKPDSRLAADAFGSAMSDIADKHGIDLYVGNILASIPEEADDDVIDAAAEAIRRELGGSVVEEIKGNPSVAPWDGKGKVPANLEPKPWQKGARKAPVADLFG